MKIAILTIYSTPSWQEIVDLTFKNTWEYCDRWGYEFRSVPYPDPVKSDLGYEKIVNIQKLFNKEHFDLIWSIDGDAIITNHQIPISRYIDDDHDMFVTTTPDKINCGSFIIKNTEWSYDFLNWIMKQRGHEGMHCEQDAVVRFCEEYPKNPIKILGHPSINSLMYNEYPEYPSIIKAEDGQWAEDCLLLHLPAIGIERRKQLLSEAKIKK